MQMIYSRFHCGHTGLFFLALLQNTPGNPFIMKTCLRLLTALLAACFLTASTSPLSAQDAPASAAPVAPQAGITAEFQQIFEQITTKLKAGQRSEAALADEVQAIDALLTKYSVKKTNEVAMVALMKARLYLEVFENTDKAKALHKQIKVDFPESEIAKNIDKDIASMEQQAAAEAMLAVGQPFPAFAEKDLMGQPLALANFKGKIVLIDFWATWCGPCVAELPHVIAAYEKYHGKGFEIVGISLDKSRDALTAFIKEKNMPWVQYFDGLGWNNKLSSQLGIHSIPATFLLDGEGKIIAKDLRGDALDQKLATLLK